MYGAYYLIVCVMVEQDSAMCDRELLDCWARIWNDVFASSQQRWRGDGVRMRFACLIVSPKVGVVIYHSVVAIR